MLLDRDQDANPDIYRLSNWWHHLGKYAGPALDLIDQEQRSLELAKLNKTQVKRLFKGDYDPASQHLTTIESTSSYDEESGEFISEIKYWRHLPYEMESGQHYVLSIRGRKDPTQPTSGGDPVILPTDIILNGQSIFSGTLVGGKHDPYWPDHRMTIERIFEMAQVMNEGLDNHDPLADTSKILNQWRGDQAFQNMTSGVSVFLQGLSENGGYSDDLTPFFLNIIDHANVDADLEIFAEDAHHLNIIHGGYTNTVSDDSLPEIFSKTATHVEGGVRFRCDRIVHEDPDTGEVTFKVRLSPKNPPRGSEACPPFDLVEMKYQKSDTGTYLLREGRFMDGPASDFQTLESQVALVGFMNRIGTDLAENRYPTFIDHIYDCRLDHYIRELSAPPPLEEGGQALHIPLNGTELKPTLGPFGGSLGGGNVIMHRGTNEKGDWDEISVLVGMPIEIGGPKSDFDGAQPDITHPDLWESIKRGVIIADHDHFDHATFEFYAEKGLMRGQKILCNERTKKIIELRMKKMGVRRDQWPIFITPKHLDVRPYGDPEDKKYHYIVRDEEGNERFHIQFCDGGAMHTAITDIHMITPCYQDKHYHTPFGFINDAFDLKERGWRFFKEGPLELINIAKQYADQFRFLAENLKKVIKSAEEQMTMFHDVTNPQLSGWSPQPEEVEKTWKHWFLSLPKDLPVMHCTFSTNHLEYQSMRKVASSAEVMRATTTIGTNAEDRSTIMNQVSVDTEMDLRSTSIPPEKIPDLVYAEVLNAIDQYLKKREEKFEKKAKKHLKIKQDERVTKNKQREINRKKKELLEKDVSYQALSDIKKKAKKSMKGINKKPKILFDVFLNGENDEYEKIIQSLGFAPKRDERSVPDSIYSSLYEAGKTEDREITDWKPNSLHVAKWCMQNIAKKQPDKSINKRIRFETLGNWNDTYMYWAIMDEQEYATTHATRTSVTAKNFRDSLGHLLVTWTGPMGTHQENQAALSRYIFNHSLVDYDEELRKSAYQLPTDVPKVHFLTQTPSMGPEAALAQSAMIKDLIVNRPDDIIFQAKQDGFEIHNPGNHLNHFLQYYRGIGKNPTLIGGNTPGIRIDGMPAHIGGHPRAENIKKFFKNLPAILHVPIHISSEVALQAWKDLGKSVGEKVFKGRVGNWIARKFVSDGEDDHDLKSQDYLSQRNWLWRIERKYGKQYGGVIRGLQTVVMRDIANKRTSTLAVRRFNEGVFERGTSMPSDNEWLLSKTSARRRQAGPSTADIIVGNQVPMSYTRSRMLQLSGMMEMPHAS